MLSEKRSNLRGVPDRLVANPAMRFRTSASFMAVMKSACSFSMTGRGVPAVARTPFQQKTLKPGRPDSATVGRSGVVRTR